MHQADRINDGQGAIWLNDVNCTGSESKLLHCGYNADSTRCRHYEDVGIHCFLSCSTEEDGGLRITAGYAEHQGRLEIKYRGEWGTVCGNRFGNVDAEVACRLLGYCSGIMQPATLIGHGQGPIWLNDVNCSGSESTILDCNFNNVTYQCYHRHDIGVHCFINCTTEDEGDLRITAGYAKHQGRLEIKYRGEWGTVCGNHFGNVDAEVACRQLGYCSGIMQPATRIRSGQGAIWLNDVNCSGSESKLLDCHFNNVTYQCYHWHDIGVHCFVNCTTEDEGDLRITAGYAKHQGRLEIKYRGEWGTICENYFGNVDAEVACRQLGYCSGIMHPANLIYDGKGAIWLNDVNCSGSENKLLDCNFNTDTFQCDYHDDVGIHCFLSCSTEDEGRLRIADGYAMHQGRLEVNYKGEWGTVCDNHFDDIDAEISCRQLGYCSGIMQPKLLIRDGHGPIWINEVKCLGSERRLLNCIYNADTSNCRHSEDVGIHCFLNCSTEDHEDEGVTPHDNVIHPTSDVVVVIIGAAAVIVGAVVLLLICWCRRHYSGRPYEEPNNTSPPRTEGPYEEPTNLSPPRTEGPYEEPNNPSPPRTEGPYEEPENPSYPRTEGLYEEPNNQSPARTRRPSGELEEPVSQVPGIYNVYDTIHDSSEVFENEDSSVPEPSMMGNAHLDIPESVA